MARPLLSLEVNSPYQGKGMKNKQRNTGFNPRQNKVVPPWQKNAAPLFPIPPRNAGILGQSPLGLPPSLQTSSSNRDRFNQEKRVPPLDEAPGILGQQPGSNNGLMNKNIPPWQQHSSRQNSLNNPPSLLDSLVQKPGPAPRMIQDNSPGRRTSSNQYQGEQEQKKDPLHRKSSFEPPDSPSLNNLEKRALAADVPQEFFEEIQSKPVGDAIQIALEFARKEFYKSKGLNGSSSGKAIGVGHHTCTTCNIRFLNRGQLTQHCSSPSHNDLEDRFNLRKEQARLIVAKKIVNSTSQPDATLVAIARAEVEMDLKPLQMDLDSYILGIYESIMKVYWPVPNSSFYCRICNYVEFKSPLELDRHNSSREHQRREETYSIAFCLYCQVHNSNAEVMAAHEKTEKHRKTKELMERTKVCAIKHWHKVNDIPLPDKDDVDNRNLNKNNPQIGSKRSAEVDHELTSPLKKTNISSSRESMYDEKPSFNDFRAKPTREDATQDNSIWFAPIRGFLCVACQVFVHDKQEQGVHVKGAQHSIKVAQFKKQLMSQMK